MHIRRPALSLASLFLAELVSAEVNANNPQQLGVVHVQARGAGTDEVRAANWTQTSLDTEEDEDLPAFYYEDGLDENFVEPYELRKRDIWKRAMGPTWKSAPTLSNSKVKAGVGAMQITITGPDSVL